MIPAFEYGRATVAMAPDDSPLAPAGPHSQYEQFAAGQYDQFSHDEFSYERSDVSDQQQWSDPQQYDYEQFAGQQQFALQPPPQYVSQDVRQLAQSPLTPMPLHRSSALPDPHLLTAQCEPAGKFAFGVQTGFGEFPDNEFDATEVWLCRTTV